MPRVLVTGGTGVLGREVVTRLKKAGYATRIMSRRRSMTAGDVEWAQADLATGQGLADAVSSIDIIVHSATNPIKQTKAIDMLGTEKLIRCARSTGVSHLIYISIVGIDRIPLNYYRQKLAAESLVEQGGIPWTILRATQFHTLIDLFLQPFANIPFVLLPTDFQFQPVDAGEVADRLFMCVAQGASGRLPDFGGPEVSTFGNLARAWVQARGKSPRIFHLPLPGKIAAGFRNGYNTMPQNRSGKITWQEWLVRKYKLAQV